VVEEATELKLVEFGAICDLQNGRAFKPIEWTDTGVPIIRIQNLNDESKPFNYCDSEVEDKFHVKNNDLLFSWSGTPGTSFGAFFWNRGFAYLNQHIFNVKVNSYSTNKSYIRYAINSRLQEIIDQAHGGVGLKHITKKKLEKVLIPLPPLPEQQKIAAILDAADSLRQKDQQLIDHYTALSQSLFLGMFGDPVTNPKGWDFIRLDSLGNISSGSTPSREVGEYYRGNIPWVKTTEVNGQLIIKTSEHISEKALSNTSCRLNVAGSLIIAMYGQGKTRGKVGKLGIEAATNQACAVIPPSDKMNFDYLFLLIKLLYEDLRKLGRGGNQPNLNCGIIKSYTVISPPLSLQNQFAERIEAIEKQKQKAQAGLEKSEDLFNSLLQRAFKGELTQDMAA
jgi:type I restriction enzyme, S subunit